MKILIHPFWRKAGILHFYSTFRWSQWCGLQGNWVQSALCNLGSHNEDVFDPWLVESAVGELGDTRGSLLWTWASAELGIQVRAGGGVGGEGRVLKPAAYEYWGMANNLTELGCCPDNSSI